MNLNGMPLRCWMGIVGLALAVFAQWAFATTVMLDTGHTPLRAGSVAPSGTTEYLYNLTFTSYLAADLTRMGVSVARVAADGQEIALNDRTQGSGGVSLFLSIHHDSIPQVWIDQGREREFSGFAVFVSEKNPYFARSVTCAQRIGAAMLAAGEHPSLYHATPLKGESRPLLDRAGGIHRYDDLVVLRTARSPAVLLEVGVIRNPDEEARLGQTEVVRALASAVASAVVKCTRGEK